MSQQIRDQDVRVLEDGGHAGEHRAGADRNGQALFARQAADNVDPRGPRGFLRRRGVMFRYVTPSGTKGADYDAEIQLDDGAKVSCEMKTKAEGTDLGDGAVRNPLQAARKQLPPGEPGLVFLKVREPWVRQRDAAQVVPAMIDAFLRGTSRVVAVVLRWEEQHLEHLDGALILYKFRLERGTPKAVAPSVDRLLTVLAGPSTADWVSFRAIAEEALVK